MSDEAKLNEIYSLRIPACTKAMVENMTNEHKSDLNRRLRVEIAKKIHELKFDPKLYLGDEQ